MSLILTRSADRVLRHILPIANGVKMAIEADIDLTAAASPDDAEGVVPAITRVVVKNFKSIAAADVDLQPLTLLVGPNGAGKSNLVDAIRLVSEALRSSLDYAIRERGGLTEVRRRSRGHPTHFGVRLELALSPGWTATYAFEIAARKDRSFEVQREDCVVRHHGGRTDYFSVRGGRLDDAPVDAAWPRSIAADSLYLPLVSGVMSFRTVYRLLTGLGFYNLNPDAIRALQTPDVGDLLLPDGGNLAAVVRKTNDKHRVVADRINEYLNTVVPGVHAVSARSLGPMETIEIRQDVAGDENPWSFYAASLSDGTLRALGVLFAAFQRGDQGAVRAVAIEEPESAIHPGASLRLMDALIEASTQRQLILTTHSPDLLDHPEVTAESVLAVEAESGNTLVGVVDERTRFALKENLYTVGELLRLEQVSPDLFAIRRRNEQLALFERSGLLA